MSKRYFLFHFLLLLSLYSFSQYPSRYFIQFTDKNNNGYSLSDPSAFLSERAIERRTHQNIGYDFSDLPVTQSYIDTIASLGATILHPTKWLNGVTIETTNQNVLNSIYTLPFVVNQTYIVGRRSNPHGKAIDTMSFIQRESLLKSSSTPHRMESPKGIDYGYGYNQIHMINGDYLHSHGYLGDGILIAILDAGFLHVDSMSGFDSIRNNNQILGTRNFVADAYNDVYEDHYHGCMVLSCIAANLPGEMVGTAPHASFWLIITEDVATENIIEEYNWASGAELADSAGADIISTSLGYMLFDNPDQNPTYADMNGRWSPASRAATIAAEKGILVCAAAGNDAQNSFWNHIGSPADADSILAVGAVDASGTYANFSSIGPSSDGRIKPDVATQGAGTTVMTPIWAPPDSLNTSANGTSFATPILAGAAACLWQAHPEKTNMQIRNAIIESASQFYAPDSLLGYGIPNFAKADSILNRSGIYSQDTLLALYPNPFTQTFSFDFYSFNSRNIDVTLTDIMGKIVDKETHALGIGSINTFTIPSFNNNSGSMPEISKGVYILQIRSANFLFTKKVVKL
jgi:serine protease AprX